MTDEVNFTSIQEETTTEVTTAEVIQYEKDVISNNVFLGMAIGGSGILVSLLVISILKIFRKGSD